MRKIGTLIGVLLITALSIAATSNATNQPKPGSCDARTASFHSHRAKAIIGKAYAHHNWRDKTPVRPAQRDHWNKHKLCLTSKERQHHINVYIVHKHHSYDRYARHQFNHHYRPYSCGSVGHLAIPCYVARCESGYRWHAVSTFSGGGMYGILTRSWYDYGGAKFGSQPYHAGHDGQSIIATKILHDAGPRAWECW